jgi:hypothetical protein
MQNLSRAPKQNRERLVLLCFLSLFLFLLPSTESLGAIQIDINTASLEDLVKIIHIGEKRALELISLRPFSSLDDLIKIKGIGEARIQDIKKQGLAWVTESQLIQEPIIETQIQEPINYSSGIIINEILPSPEGPDAENEWIEIFNQNNFIVSLADWKIEDSKGSVHTFIFSKTAQILAKEFLVLSREITKITLNNGGDGLNLIQPDGKIIDRVDFEKASLSQSYNQTESGWFWSSTLTPGKENIVIKEEFAQSEIKNISLESETDNNLSKKELAAINEQIGKPFNFLNVLFPALILAFASGIIILIIDLKNKSE